MTLTVRPLDAPLGAQVLGFDFSRPVARATRDLLLAALDEQLLLVFRNGDAPPTPAQVEDFCMSLGDLCPALTDRSRLPDHPGISLVSNREVDGVQGFGGNGIIGWHSDLRFAPPLIEIVYLDALAVTSTGGRTKLTNLRAAYDAFDPELARHLDSMVVRYGKRTDLDCSDLDFRGGPVARVDLWLLSNGILTTRAAAKASCRSGDVRVNGDVARAATRIGAGDRVTVRLDGNDRELDLVVMPTIVVPLVQVNHRNGRKALWPNMGPDFTTELVGLPSGEGAELFDMLYCHCIQDQFVYVHDWQVGDALLWLNNQTMHEREAFPDTEERILRHVNILGTTGRPPVPTGG